MALGDTVVSEGVEYEVVWDGGEGLVGERITKVTGVWTPPKRLYNKKSDYWERRKSGTADGLDKAVVPTEDLRLEDVTA